VTALNEGSATMQSPQFIVLVTTSLVSSLIIAVLTNVMRHMFGNAARAAGLAPSDAVVAAKRVAAGDLSGMLEQVAPAARGALRAAGLTSFADGFAAASLLAACIAVLACLLTVWFVRFEDTAPSAATGHRPCKFVDCRDPL